MSDSHIAAPPQPDSKAGAASESTATAPDAAGQPAAFRSSLKKNVVYAILGNAFYNACRFGVVVLIAKFASAEILGQYNLAIALISPIALFFSLQLRTAMVADARNEFTYGTYRTLRTLGMIATGFVVVVMMIRSARSNDGLYFVIILAGTAIVRLANSSSELCWGKYLKRERVDTIAWSNAWTGAGLLAPFLLAVPIYGLLVRTGAISSDRLAEGTALAVAGAGLTSWAAYYFFDRPRTTGQPDCNPAWNWPDVWKLTKHTIPLGLVLLIISLCDTIPRALIEKQPDGLAALGYFGAVAYIAMTANLLLIQAGVAATNRLAQYYTTNFRAFLRLTLLLTGFALLLGVLIMGGTLLFGKWVLRTLYTSDYAAYYWDFVVVVLSQCLGLLTSIFGITSTQMRLYWLQVTIHAIVLVATVTAAYLLIAPGYAVRGAAWTMVVRAGVQFVLYAVSLAYNIWRRSQQPWNEPPAPPPADADVAGSDTDPALAAG